MYWAKFLIGFSLLFLSDMVLAQEELLINHQLWMEYNPSYNTSEKISLSSPLGIGTILDDRWTQLYTKPSVKIGGNKYFEFLGGVGFYYTARGEKSNRLEIRPWQGVKVKWPHIAELKFYHYLRVEQRISYAIDDWVRTYDTRLRYKVGFKRELSKIWYLSGYAEFFFDKEDAIDEIFRNKGKGGVSIGYKMDHQWSWELDFIFKRSRLRSEDMFQTSDYYMELKAKHCLSCPNL